ncbi:MAG: exodeoxyribonuclease III [Alphaproteobacteria bacterium]|nr:exodeoxyribonuclease III [Alphaproteobacteria bacterium]
MKIITWNINSIRLRLPLLKQLAEQENPDIIALQETKVSDDLFPLLECQALGYPHVAFRGDKGYNGMAILSKPALKPVEHSNFGGRGDARHLAVEVNGVELHDVYIPAGADIPDPAVNPSFAHKLQFVEDLTTCFSKPEWKKKSAIMLGDFNIAPQEHDVWSHKQLLKVVSHTPPETERLDALQKTLGWVDSSRQFTPSEQKLYSWWSYRNRDWRKSDRGRRLDHIWVTPNLRSALRQGYILKDSRDWNGPSDHVPVVAVLD